MIELARGLSFVRYSRAAGENSFTVTFPYLAREHVRAFVGPTEDDLRPVFAKWIDSTSIQIPSQDAELGTAYFVVLRRVTPTDRLLVDWKNGANMPAADLNLIFKQLLFLQQEHSDNSGTTSGIPGGGTGSDPNAPDINVLINQILQSQALAELVNARDLIDLNAELMLDQLRRSNDYFDLARYNGSRIAIAETKLDTVVTDTSALAEQITTLLANFATEHQNNAAVFSEINRAIADETSARVTTYSQLEAKVDTNNSTALAGITEAKTAVTTEAAARTSAMNLLEGKVNTNKASVDAAVSRLDTADATEAASRASAITAVESRITDEVNNRAAAIASVNNTMSTKIDATQANAIASTQVTAFKDGEFATLKASYNVTAGQNSSMYGQWSAAYSVRIAGQTADGRQVVSGIAMSANATQGSDIVFMADRVGIATPVTDANGKFIDVKVPFVVGTVGGVSTVGINGQLVVDGTISANKIKVTSLSAVSANMGTVNGGTFKTHTLDANGDIVDPNEFRVEVSNLGNWPIWVGSGVKNENNAVFWVDRSGNAKFSGKVTAPNIVGKFQSAIALNWSGNTPLTVPGTWMTNGWQTVSTFVLPTPQGVGENHTPAFSITVYCTPGAPGLDVIIEQYVSNSWVEVGRTVTGNFVGPGSYYGYLTNGGNTPIYYTSGIQSLSVNVSGVGQSTDTSSSFRVRAQTRDIILTNSDGPQNIGTRADYAVTKITGFIFGIR